MIDLSACRARARTIATELEPGAGAGFLAVSDWSSATDAIMNGDAPTPALYVSLSREQPDKNRMTSGGRAQRVRSTVSLLFCLAAERASGERADPIEIARGALIDSFVGYSPPGAVAAVDYAGYSIRQEDDGLVWGEVLVSTSWDLRKAT
jgi:hypothetical protein